MEGIGGGHGERLSVGLEEVLANRSATQKRNRAPFQAVFGLGEGQQTWIEDIIEW